MGNIHLTKASEVEEEQHEQHLKSILSMVIENTFDEYEIPQKLKNEFDRQKASMMEG